MSGPSITLPPLVPRFKLSRFKLPRVKPISDSVKRSFGLTGLRTYLKYKGYRLIVRTLPMLGLGDLLLGQPYMASEYRDRVSNFDLLHPAQTLDFSTPGIPFSADGFLRNCQNIVEGRLDRDHIFVCEVPSAKFSPENGLLFDSQWRNVVEAILDYGRFFTFRKTFRPREITRRTGPFSSIQHPWHYNNWHWTADSLPQICSLARHMQGRPLTLLMSNQVCQVHRDSLAAILPPNFAVEYVPPTEWFDVETFVMPSFVSSRCNAFFPPEYYTFIRSRTFENLAIAAPARRTGRYYISRARARHRRVINEDELVALLARFGIQKVLMEDYTFREQVSLFRNSEIIVSPHGAGLGGIIYGESLDVCVLYPEARPAGYFYTLARGAGHRHFCVNSDVAEDDDFEVDLAALRRVLTEEMGMQIDREADLQMRAAPTNELTALAAR